jgi:CheY-like chemotaxis protein
MVRVLIVEDDPSVALMLSDAVTFFGHDPAIEADSLIAAQRVREGWDVLLTDYLMPRLDGIELATVFQQAAPKVRRVVITAAPREQAIAEALRSGVVQLVLSKPTTLTDLRSAFLWL